jgi:hypothetical protein
MNGTTYCTVNKTSLATGSDYRNSVSESMTPSTLFNRLSVAWESLIGLPWWESVIYRQIVRFHEYYDASPTPYK